MGLAASLRAFPGSRVYDPKTVQVPADVAKEIGDMSARELLRLHQKLDFKQRDLPWLALEPSSLQDANMAERAADWQAQRKAVNAAMQNNGGYGRTGALARYESGYE